MQPVVERTRPWLMRGDRDPAVRPLQEALNRRGASPRLSVDGDFGRHTHAAVIDFQKKTPEIQNVTGGVAGEKTLRALAFDERVCLPMRRPRVAGPISRPAHEDASPDWRKELGLGFERVSYGNLCMDPNTETLAPVPGLAYVVSGCEKLAGSRVTCPDGVWLRHGPADPDRTLQDRNECALYPQCFGVSRCGTWRRGPQVMKLAPASLRPGTVVATMRDGVYHSDYSGRSHVGVFDSFAMQGDKVVGFYLWEQYNGADIGRVLKKFGEPYVWWTYEKKSHPENDIPNIDTGYAGADGKTHWRYEKNLVYKYFRQPWVRYGEEYFVVYSDGKSARETD